METTRDLSFFNWGLTVLVSTSPVVKAYFENSTETTDTILKHARFAKSIGEAVQLIQADRDNESNHIEGQK